MGETGHQLAAPNLVQDPRSSRRRKSQLLGFVISLQSRSSALELRHWQPVQNWLRQLKSMEGSKSFAGL